MEQQFRDQFKHLLLALGTTGDAYAAAHLEQFENESSKGLEHKNRFAGLERNLPACAAIMIQSMMDLEAYDQEMFEEFLEAAHKILVDRNS